MPELDEYASPGTPRQGRPARPPRLTVPLANRWRRLRHQSLSEQNLQTARRLVPLAQHEQLRSAAESGAERRALAADLAIGRRGATIQPQVGLAIELILQVVSERFFRGVMPRTSERAIPG